MKKFSLPIYLSIVIFVLQLLGVVAFNQTIQESIVRALAKVPLLPVLPGQKQALRASSQALASRFQPGNKIFLFGGSTSVNFFEHIDSLEDVSGLHFHNLTCSAESMFDALRLASNSNGPGIAVLGIHPAKMFAHTDAQVVKGRYMTGQNYFFLLPSPDAENFYRQGGTWRSHPSAPHRRFATLNPEFGLISQAKRFLFVKKAQLVPFFAEYNFNLQRISEAVVRTASAEELTRLNDGKLNNVPEAVDQQEDDEELVGLDIQKRVERFKSYRKSLATNSDRRVALNFAILNEIETVLWSKGIALAIFETPVGALYREKLPDYISRYNEAMTEFLGKHPRVKRYSLPWSIHAGDEALFSDSMHLTHEGTNFFRPHFMSLLRETILPEAGIGIAQ